MADPVTASVGAAASPETASPEAAATEADLERGARGQLVIKDRAVSKVAVAAALSVPGVVRQSGGLLKLPGRDLPRAEITTGDHAVAITLYLAVAWPCPVAALSHEVHGTVADRVATLTGLTLDHLHIVVAAAVPRTDATAEVDARQLVAEGEQEWVAPPSRPPLARPDAAVVAVVAAIALLGIAVVAGREFLIAQEVIAPAAWLRNTVQWVAELHWQAWMGFAAGACALIGVLLVVLAAAPRTRTHEPVGSGTPVVWLRPTDIARMCSARAGALGTVASAHTTVDRRRVTVHVTPAAYAGTDADLEAQIREAVAPALDALSNTRELRVRIGRPRP